MCQVMFYNPRTGVFPSHLTNATDWTLGCKKSGKQIYTPDKYLDLSIKAVMLVTRSK